MYACAWVRATSVLSSAVIFTDYISNNYPVSGALCNIYVYIYMYVYVIYISYRQRSITVFIEGTAATLMKN